MDELSDEASVVDIGEHCESKHAIVRLIAMELMGSMRLSAPQQ